MVDMQVPLRTAMKDESLWAQQLAERACGPSHHNQRL